MVHTTLIAAMERGGIIGSEAGGIPWDLPRDRAHFRRYTAGKWILVGRRTCEEMTGWFGERTPVILTRQRELVPARPWHRVVSSVAQAIDLATRSGIGELVVCGGAGAYAAALPFADRLVLTTVETEIALEDPVRFPGIPLSDRWHRVSRERWPADRDNEFPMILEIFDRH